MEKELHFLRNKVNRLEATIEFMQNEIHEKLSVVLEKFFNHKAEQIAKKKRALEKEEDIFLHLMSCCNYTVAPQTLSQPSTSNSISNDYDYDNQQSSANKPLKTRKRPMPPPEVGEVYGKASCSRQAFEKSNNHIANNRQTTDITEMFEEQHDIYDDPLNMLQVYDEEEEEEEEEDECSDEIINFPVGQGQEFLDSEENDDDDNWQALDEIDCEVMIKKENNEEEGQQDVNYEFGNLDGTEGEMDDKTRKMMMRARSYARYEPRHSSRQDSAWKWYSTSRNESGKLMAKCTNCNLVEFSSPRVARLKDHLRKCLASQPPPLAYHAQPTSSSSPSHIING